MADSALPMETDCHTVQRRLGAGGDFLLLDCREQDEYDLARIAGAKLIPMSELESRLGELEPYRHRELAVHCHHGGRSMRVVSWLRERGFSQAQSMAGGIDQWSQDIDGTVPRY